jgi:hypothetical protein
MKCEIGNMVAGVVGAAEGRQRTRAFDCGSARVHRRLEVHGGIPISKQLAPPHQVRHQTRRGYLRVPNINPPAEGHKSSLTHQR